jgi:hypothetical protein
MRLLLGQSQSKNRDFHSFLWISWAFRPFWPIFAGFPRFLRTFPAIKPSRKAALRSV